MNPTYGRRYLTQFLGIFQHIFLFSLLLHTNANGVVHGRRVDGDELVNTSFNGKIRALHTEDGNCELLMDNGQWEEAKAKVAPISQMPTCMREFYKTAHLPVCGKPMFNKFKYCAKALLSGNKDYDKVDFRKEWEQKKQLLVLVDGCLNCLSWPERAANVTILLYHGDVDIKEEKEGVGIEPAEAKTESDAFGDFKIGAIFKINGEKVRQFRPRLVIKHFCNQYGMSQKKIIHFPVLYPHRMNELTFEGLNAHIQLIQQGKREVILDWDGQKDKNKTAVSITASATTVKP